MIFKVFEYKKLETNYQNFIKIHNYKNNIV